MLAEKKEIKNQIDKLSAELAQNGLNIRKRFLFGSYAKNTQKEHSDIDIALISDQFEGIRFIDFLKISDFLIKYDSRLEIHPFKTSEFNPSQDFFVKEILKTAIEI